MAYRSCILHRFLKNEWRSLTSQTIGVEFSSKIIKLGPAHRRKRIKFQLWDTAGTERFRSVSRSYYRGAAGAILVYDIASYASFGALPTFLDDARALASPDLTTILAGNKSDLADGEGDMVGNSHAEEGTYPPTPSSTASKSATSGIGISGKVQTATIAIEGRQVPQATALQWASKSGVPVHMEVSAYSGAGVADLFTRLASMILTKIELGEIDPDDPASGIQYGDSGWGDADAGSMRSGGTTRRRRARGGTGLREWEQVFRVGGVRRRGCC